MAGGDCECGEDGSVGSVGVPRNDHCIRNHIFFPKAEYIDTIETSKKAIKKKTHAANRHDSLGRAEASSSSTAAPRRWRVLHKGIVLKAIFIAQKSLFLLNLHIAEIYCPLFDIVAGVWLAIVSSLEFIDRVDEPVE